LENLIFASTACVYPDELQAKVGSDYKLKEEDSDASNLTGYLSADIEYGWSKLMSEIQLNAFVKQYGMKGSSVRFVTAYGPRENETHAIIALIYKAIKRMDPYPIWGNGRQERDFTYVDDIVDGTIRAANRIYDGTPVNLGTGNRYSIIKVANTIFEIVEWKPRQFEFETSKPVGPLSRALDNNRAKKLLGWEPKVTLENGLRKTINWYLKANKLSKGYTQSILVDR
jgi:UDP-glucose 4-epimerase